MCVHNDKDYLNHFFFLFSFILVAKLSPHFLNLGFFFPQISLFLNHAYPTLNIFSSTHRQARLYSSPFIFFSFRFFFHFKLACWVWVVDSNLFAGFCGSNRHVVCGRLWLVVACDVLVVTCDGCYG